jgi:hypothetical protein
MAIYTSAKVAGVRGIFRSDNEGASWVRINDDQHQYAWTGKAITGDPRVYGRVYFATNGRGIIYGDLNSGAAMIAQSAPLQKPKAMLSVTPNPTSGHELNFRFEGDKTHVIAVSVSDFKGQRFVQRLFRKSDFENNNASLKLPGLRKGLYLLHLNSGERTYTTRFLVE